MEQVIKTYLGMFFIVILSCIGFGLITSAIIARSANNLACQYSTLINCSGLSDEVISQCQEKVKGNTSDAYDDLSVDIKEDSNGKKYGTMILKYHYIIPIIGIESRKTISRMII